MDPQSPRTWIAFAGSKRIAFGPPQDVAANVKAFVDGGGEDAVLVFDAASSQTVELDLRGSVSAVLKRLSAMTAGESGSAKSAPAKVRAPGRPKLGVIAREVTLLPRHWDWLGEQPGGASVALRKLVERALRTNGDEDRIRRTREAAYRFMNVMAGNAPRYEEALRALFAGDHDRLRKIVAKWPADVRKHALALAEGSCRMPHG
jgi:hypothetical protein